MGMRSFLSELFQNDLKGAQEFASRSAALADDEDSDEVEGLNFRTAIEAHRRWKARLSDYLAGTSQEQLDRQAVGRDDQCVLGKWIHGPGGEHFGAMDGFDHLKQRHAYFHVCAGKILGLAQSGQKESAMQELLKGDYARVSIDVLRDLAKLYLTLQRGR